jgi:Caspase domain.
MKRLLLASLKVTLPVLLSVSSGLWQGVYAEDSQAVINRPVKDKWALVIGVSQFANPALNLKYSAKDAQDFADYLKKEAGFAPDHVKVLINEEATEKRILSLLGNKWLPHAAGPDDLVVIFVSTHGSGAELDVGGQKLSRCLRYRCR